MLVNLKGMLEKAYENQYAVGSFNCYNLETFQGVIQAAEEKKSPVIVAFGAKYLDNMSLKTAASIVKSLAEDCSVDICLHLDHCSDLNIVFKAITAGFSSVMYDGSYLTFEENMKNTKKVVEVAHASEVSVEAELGSLAAGLDSHEGSNEDIEKYTDPEAAKKFIDETNVDCLAVSIGTVHGLYQGKPEIRIDILKEINRLCKLPLVLHGGSGTPEEDLKACIKNGVTKINVNTEISNNVIDFTKEILADKKMHFSQLSKKQKEIVSNTVKKHIDLYKS